MSFVLPTLNAYIIDPVGAVFAQAAEAASVVLCLPVLLQPAALSPGSVPAFLPVTSTGRI